MIVCEYIVNDSRPDELRQEFTYIAVILFIELTLLVLQNYREAYSTAARSIYHENIDKENSCFG